MLILTTINVTFAVLLYAYIIATKEKEERQTDEIQLQPRRVWRSETRLTEERKQQSGQFFSLVDTHLRLQDPAVFLNYTRLTSQLFDEVLQKITSGIESAVTSFRQPLSPALKLTVTQTPCNRRILSFLYRPICL